MQNNIWNCGPASLATVLNRLGVNATQDDIASLAGTDYTGTSMAGLVYAAEVKGLNQSITAAGMLITNLEQLKPNNIVLLSTVSGLYHYCIITNITNTTVFLADSSLGNINMTIGNFTSVYTGYVLVVTNDTNSTQFNNATFLNYEMMQITKGTVIPIVIGAIVLAGGFDGFAIMVAGSFIGVGIGNLIWNNRNNGNTQSSGTVNGVALGSGYGYSTSYSYSHGYRPRSYTKVYAPYTPPVYTISYWGLTSDGSWGLITTTTTGNPDDLKNQKILEAYNQKLNSELAKIAGIIESYLSNDEYNELNRYPASFYKKTQQDTPPIKMGVMPPDPKGDKSQFILNYYKEAMKDIKNGKSKIGDGNSVGGTKDIMTGIAKLYYLSFYVITEITPSEIWP